MTHEARSAIAREWLYIIDTLIENTAQKYNEVQDAGRDDLRFFYAGKRSCLDYFRELAMSDIESGGAASGAQQPASGEIPQQNAE